jgi:hypothetical protein
MSSSQAVLELEEPTRELMAVGGQPRPWIGNLYYEGTSLKCKTIDLSFKLTNWKSTLIGKFSFTSSTLANKKFMFIQG